MEVPVPRAPPLLMFPQLLLTGCDENTGMTKFEGAILHIFYGGLIHPGCTFRE